MGACAFTFNDSVSVNKITLAKEWVNILSITLLSPGSPDSPDSPAYAVAIEYTVLPDPSFKQSNYKTATRWVKDVVVVQAEPQFLEEAVARRVWDTVVGIRKALDAAYRSSE